MRRYVCACIALGSLAFFGLGDSASALDRPGGFSRPSGVRAGFRHARVAPGVFPRRFAHRPFRGGGIPLYLDNDYGSDGVNVVIQQNFGSAGAVASPYSIPSFSQLPVSAGIREARPSTAAVYVINATDRSVAESRNGAPRSSGAKVLSLQQDEAADEIEPPFGAKIIHLTVPVAPRG